MIKIAPASSEWKARALALLSSSDMDMPVFTCIDGDNLLACAGFYYGIDGELDSIWVSTDTGGFDAKTATVKAVLNHMDLIGYERAAYHKDAESSFLRGIGFSQENDALVLSLKGYFDHKCSCPSD